MDIVNITDAEFQTAVLQSTTPVLVDFWAGWCAPCKRLAPEFEKLSEKYPGIKFVKVNVDQNPVSARSCNVMSLPTLVLFRPGEAPSSFIGFAPAADIEKRLALGGV